VTDSQDLTPGVLRLPIKLPPHGEGICECCRVRTRVRAVQGDDGVEQLCEGCCPASTEPTTTNEGTT